MIAEEIRKNAKAIGRDLKIMEVCGSHTMAIFRSGLKAALPESLTLLSGPGCPVCVTEQGDLERIIHLSLLDEVILVTFGDMLKVPSAKGTLFEARAKGADIRVIYSPLEALKIAKENPGKTIVYNAIGFETTAPITAVLIKKAEEEGLENLKVYSSHKMVPPALEALFEGGSDVDGLILPGHVSAIIGLRPYEFIAERYGKPAVAAGFEAENILEAIGKVLEQLVSGKPAIDSVYGAVTSEGNRKALEALFQYFESSDANWRGFGKIPESGLELRPEFARHDAKKHFDLSFKVTPTPQGCRCGEIIKGQARPTDCPFFGKACRPEKAIGPCMVSSEGACAAWYKYGSLEERALGNG